MRRYIRHDPQLGELHGKVDELREQALRVSLHHGYFFFFQAEDGIRDVAVTGVQTCALPIFSYCIPGPTELPSFELDPMETPTPVNPLGAKGIGEAGTIGATPAVHAAVLDALKPLGITELEMPLGSERVWQAVHQAPWPGS